MSQPTYFSLKIAGLAASREDLLTMELFEMGAEGVQEDLSFQQRDKKYLPEVVHQDIKTLVAYFSSQPQVVQLEALQANYPETQIALDEQPIKDWLNEWKKQWEAFELTKGFWVVPSWLEKEFHKKDVEPLWIDPGMAFGTGTHDTTQIASRLLSDLIDDVAPHSMVDVGTGSGILSILAFKKGLHQCLAYDNDPEAERVFRENTEKNGAQEISWDPNWASKKKGEFQLVVANIIDGVLLDLKDDFKKLEAPFYLWTGILKERESDFLKEMLLDWPLKLKVREEQGEWVGFVFEACP